MNIEKNISEKNCKYLSKCNERINKIYSSQGDKISMSQIKRILGVPVHKDDECLILEKGNWRVIGA